MDTKLTTQTLPGIAARRPLAEVGSRAGGFHNSPHKPAWRSLPQLLHTELWLATFTLHHVPQQR